MEEKQGVATEIQDLGQQELDQVSGGSRRWTYFCSHCGEGFQSEDELKSHLEDAHGIITCPMCKTPMHKDSACEVCGYAGIA